MNARTLILTATISLAATCAFADEIARVSVGNGGVEAIGRSLDATISANGAFIAFVSNAQNLAPNDTGSANDVFLRDRFAGTTKRISTNRFNFPGNAASTKPALSEDGRFVAFATDATNLFDNDTNANTDVVLFDRDANTLTLVSKSAAGVQANNRSSDPSISADGRFVAFTSLADNLLPGANSDTNATGDVFVKDMQTGVVTRASVRANGGQLGDGGKQGKISGNGRFVVFASIDPTIVVAGDDNGAEDIFVRDLQTNNTIPVSRTPLFRAGNGRSVFPSISADGRFVAFSSTSSDLIDNDTNGVGDVFVVDRERLVTERVSFNNDETQHALESRRAAISADGRFVAMEMDFPFAPGGAPLSEVMVCDRSTHTMFIVSFDIPTGFAASLPSTAPSITGDGRTVVFSSDATELVEPDTNGQTDVFAYRFTKCVLGDTLAGSLETPSDFGLVGFEALAGTKVKIRLELVSGARLPSVLAIDALGDRAAEIVSAPGRTTIKKKFRIPRDGYWAFAFQTQDGAPCSYRMTTSAKLPKAGRSFTKNNAKGRRPNGIASFDLGLLPGARVTVRAQERRQPIDTLGAAFVDPQGHELARVFDVAVDRAAPSDLFTDLDLRTGQRATLGVSLPQGTKARIQVVLEQPTGGFVVFVP